MISCILASMDRTDNLIKILPSWAKISYIKEIVLCDWGSKEPIYEDKDILNIIKEYKNIKIIRINNQKFYFRCKALNLAYRFTDNKYPYLLKIDADYLNLNFDNEFFDNIIRMNLLDENYYHGAKETSEYGLLITKKIFFEKLKGYNENFKSAWGFEDVDLYRKLGIKLKLNEIEITSGEMIYHIPHDENLRLKNQQFKEKDLNSNASELDADWPMKDYRVIKSEKFYLEVELNE